MVNVWSWLFPERCVECGVVGSYVCAECLNKVREIREPICPMCGEVSIGGQTHARCRRTYGMDGLVAVINYQGLGRKLVSKYKYKWVEDMHKILIETMVSGVNMEMLPEYNWLVVPVPLHPRRERWRGFNQAAKLAQGMAKYLGGSYEEETLRRTRMTKTQKGLARKERLKNLKGAFRVEKERISGKKILLIDDVWTTGTTMRECAKVLKRGGSEIVWGLTLARPEKR